jgi:hypothetical protein
LKKTLSESGAREHFFCRKPTFSEENALKGQIDALFFIILIFQKNTQCVKKGRMVFHASPQ